MTSHETRYSTRNKSAASDQNDLKKLKSKYSAKLPTLKVLFSDWSDDDLLFVLEEANGDLDITIDRISEGHANQWGEVKTKKSKKEAQKAKAATAIVSTNQQQSTITPYRDTKPTSSRSYNSPRAGKAPFTQRTRTPKTASWDTQPKATTTTTSQEVSSGSWASIAKQHSDTFGNDDSWNTSNDNVPASTTDEWGTTTNSAPANDTITTNDIADDDQPKTWASLLKSKSKTEPEAEESETNNDWEAPSSSSIVNTDAWDSNVNTTTSGWDAPNEPVADEWSTPVHETTAVESEPVKEQEEEKEPTPVISNTLLNQEEPVLLPNETTSISNLDVKFGSLNVNEDNNTVEETIKETTVVAEPPVEEPVVAAAAAPVQQTISTAPPTSATTAPVTNDAFNQSYLKQQQEPAYSQQPAVPQQQQVQPPQQQQPVQPQQQQQIPQQPLQQQQQIPQQQGVPQQQAGVPQQQQQQLGMDHLTSAYSSYLPNQPPTGASGFGMNPMGNLPDYGIYGTEAQRAAAMGYYDPTAFSHSPSVTSASVYGRDKYTQDQSQSIPQQQMYPPYYQYYYMPNQFNAYQQSAYGQPFMNKYPYQGKPTNTAAGATASPYGSVSSPYQSQLYNNHQYDDLNIDYQKSMYPQYQGFLGNLNGQPQQQGQQPPQQQQQQQAQTPSKETTGTPASSAPQAQQQQPAPQQQLPQQYANYFGQPQQMFSYGQYPQYQQQQQRQQQQQQYWNQ